jgi:hypothetical protein
VCPSHARHPAAFSSGSLVHKQVPSPSPLTVVLEVVYAIESARMIVNEHVNGTVSKSANGIVSESVNGSGIVKTTLFASEIDGGDAL